MLYLDNVIKREVEASQTVIYMAPSAVMCSDVGVGYAGDLGTKST